MEEQNQATTQSPTAQSPIYQESQEKNAKWLWLLIVLIIIGALVFAYFRGLGPFAQFRSGGETVSPTPEASPQTIESPSPSPSEEVDKSKVAIRVLNGSGEVGIASSVKDFLEGLGWKVTSIGNADNYDFEETVVTLKEGFSKFENSLVSDLSDRYSVSVSSDILDATDEADIEVIVGSK